MKEHIVKLKALHFESSDDLETILHSVSLDFIPGRSFSARLRLCRDVMMGKKSRLECITVGNRAARINIVEEDD